MNLFAGLLPAPGGETCDTLLRRDGVRVVRIVSHGAASPPGFWYDQVEGEFVALIIGAAHLRFADEDEARILRAGDWLDIAPHRRHRVEWTDPAQGTVWLAIFYPASSDAGTQERATTAIGSVPAAAIAAR
jgi:cupin 2 domain-containing protein